MVRRGSFVFAVILLLTLGRPAAAFTHVVQRGETLASIAERMYGKIQFENVLVAANALDAQGGSPIVPGQRLEIPTISYHRVSPGESWASIASVLLGEPERATVLAQANDSVPWIPPSEGAELVVPYNLRYLVTQTDTLVTIANRFLGDKERAWVLDHYNHLKGQALRRGDVVLVPLTDLPLTDAGKTEALGPDNLAKLSVGQAREAQRKVEAELPVLLSEVRGGRYVDAITRGVRMLELGELTKAQLGIIHRHLTEAYAALDATGLAAASCAAWLDHDKRSRLDPSHLSPKILAVCSKARP